MLWTALLNVTKYVNHLFIDTNAWRLSFIDATSFDKFYKAIFPSIILTLILLEGILNQVCLPSSL